MKTFGIIAACIFGAFLLMLAIGAGVSPAKSRAYAYRDRVAAECDKMMSDSSLGGERRFTRGMCDQLKEKAQYAVDHADDPYVAPVAIETYAPPLGAASAPASAPAVKHKKARVIHVAASGA